MKKIRKVECLIIEQKTKIFDGLESFSASDQLHKEKQTKKKRERDAMG
jgi:hypothetical protein